MAYNMWRNHLFASLFLILGTANLMLLNVWLVPSACPPSGDPISTATSSDVLERTPEVEETPIEKRTAEQVPQDGLSDVAVESEDVVERSTKKAGDGHSAQTTEAIEPQQNSEVISDLADIAVEPEKKAQSSAKPEVPGTTPALEPISAPQDSGWTEQSPAEPRYRTLHHAVVQFFFDGDVLKSAARNILGEVVRVHREHPGAEIQVDGHTDNHGSEDYNYRLSEQRASMIAALLEAEGVPSGRIQVRGHGPSQPLDIRNNMAASAKNRRVEITIRSRLP